MEQKVLTICETSKILRVSRPVALSLIREGRLRAIKVGLRGQWRIDENAITEFLRGGRGEEKKQTTA